MNAPEQTEAPGEPDVEERYLEAFSELERNRSAVSDYRLPAPNTAWRWPDFLVIGAQKAGTTWVHQMLLGHPYVWLPPIKEINYFNEVYYPSAVGYEASGRAEQIAEAEEYFASFNPSDVVSRSRREAIEALRSGPISDEWYGRIFAHAGVDMVCGEVCPDYGLLPRAAIAKIYHNNPALRVALVMRDPIERAWSHLKMASHPRFGGISITDLMESEWLSFQVRSNYPAIIARWRSALPERNVLLVDFEMIATEPQRVAQDICGWLGLTYDSRFFWRLDSMPFVGEPIAMDADVYEVLRERLAFVYQDMMAISPELAQRWSARHYGA